MPRLHQIIYMICNALYRNDCKFSKWQRSHEWRYKFFLRSIAINYSSMRPHYVSNPHAKLNDLILSNLWLHVFTILLKVRLCANSEKFKSFLVWHLYHLILPINPSRNVTGHGRSDIYVINHHLPCDNLKLVN